MKTPLVILSVVSLLLLAASCTTERPHQEQSAVATDEAVQRENEMAEIRQRNQSLPAFTTEELHQLMSSPENSAAIKRWRETRSYYALFEIAEGTLEPELGRMRRADVEELLGKGSPDYPNSNGRILEYGSERRLPFGSHLLITFDEKEVAHSIEWVSE